MRRSLNLLLALALAAGPAAAGGLGLFGAYWDTSDLDEAGGGGLAIGIPLGRSVDLDLRATYYEELSDDPLDDLFDGDSVFRPGSIEVVPLELGLRFNFGRGGGLNPYLGGGASYFLLDAANNRVDVDDEVGFYLLLGSRLGDGRGIDFFVDGVFRQIEATVKPTETGVALRDEVEVNLGGIGINAGLVWTW